MEMQTTPWLDEEYDSGYGGADCRPFHAYTATRIYSVHEYDGSTHISHVMRNPAEGDEPQFV